VTSGEPIAKPAEWTVFVFILFIVINFIISEGDGVMSTKRVFLHLLFIFAFVFNLIGTVRPIQAAIESGVSPGSEVSAPDLFRLDLGRAHPSQLANLPADLPPLPVLNNATELPTGYTVAYVLDTAALVGEGKLQPDCVDLRVTYGTDPSETELDRLVEGCNSTATTIRFRTQASIPVAGEDAGYHLYYGNADAGPAPADPSNVYALFDDFQDGDATGWNPAKGTWSVVDDGGNYVYRYTGGGANWAISYLPLPGASDLDYVAKMRAAATTTWIGLAFRIQDANNFLTFYESRDGNLLKYASVNNDVHEPVNALLYTMNADTWYYAQLGQPGAPHLAIRVHELASADPIYRHDLPNSGEYRPDGHYQTIATDWDDVQTRLLVDSEPTAAAAWETALVGCPNTRH
jgi:hypothetical protein